MDPFVTVVPVVADAFRTLGIVIGWVLVGFVGLLGVAILWLVVMGRIDLGKLISEADGDASMSRFQLLIFTFVISLSLFYIIVSTTPPAFPEKIPPEILGLLGISAGSYVISKGIQKSHETATTRARTGGATATGSGLAPQPQTISVIPAKQSVTARTDLQFMAEVTYADGTVKRLMHGHGMDWQSSMPTVAGINTHGVASAHQAGTATITATLGSVSGSATLEVISPPP